MPPIRPKPSTVAAKDGAGARYDWYDNFHYLIQSGHQLKDIANYPLSVFRGFQLAAQREQSRQAKRMFNIVSEATHGTPDSRKAFWKDLGNG
jgi:hypothetical protein